MHHFTVKSRLIIILAALLLFFAGTSVPTQAKRLLLPRVYSPRGSVTIDGALAPAGVQVTAWISGVQRASGLTNASGSYSLVISGEDVDLGKAVSFRVFAAGSWRFAPQGGTYTDLASPTINLTVSTVVAPTPTRTRTPTATATPLPATLCVTVFMDANANQVRDAGELGIAGAEINAYTYPTETLAAAGFTDPQGSFCVNLVAGDYIVDEVDPPGLSSTTRHSRAARLFVGQRKDIAFGDIGALADTPTPGPTNTATTTRTPTITATYTNTPTAIPSLTPTATATVARSSTPTATRTSAPSATTTPTATLPPTGPIDLLVGTADIWTSPISVRQGDLVSLGVNVHNTSGVAVPDVLVEFWIGGVGTGARLDGLFLIPIIPPYGMGAVATGPLWDTSGLEGEQIISVIVQDLQGEDTNSSNNTASRPVDIHKALDIQPPSGALTINDGAAATTALTVTLGLDAADSPGGSGLQWMYIVEFGLNAATHQWEATHDLGWIGYQPARAWTLRGPGGVKYLAAWFADAAGNVSALPAMAMINYIPAGQNIAAGEWHVYRWALPAGDTVALDLHTLSGDADLYLWQPGNLGAPNWWSANDGAASDEIAFTAPVAGVYQAQVYGYADSSYTLTMTPGGQPGQSVKSGRRALLDKSAPEQPFSNSAPPTNLFTPTLRGFISYIQLLLKLR
jgi:hypothetical protein